MRFQDFIGDDLWGRIDALAPDWAASAVVAVEPLADLGGVDQLCSHVRLNVVMPAPPILGRGFRRVLRPAVVPWGCY